MYLPTYLAPVAAADRHRRLPARHAPPLGLPVTFFAPGQLTRWRFAGDGLPPAKLAATAKSPSSSRNPARPQATVNGKHGQPPRPADGADGPRCKLQAPHPSRHQVRRHGGWPAARGAERGVLLSSLQGACRKHEDAKQQLLTDSSPSLTLPSSSRSTWRRFTTTTRRPTRTP